MPLALTTQVCRRHATMLFVAGVALAAGVAAWWRTGPAHARTDAERRAALADDLIRRGQAAYRKLEAVPFAALESRDAVRDVLGRATVVHPEHPAARDVGPALDAVAALLHHRFGGGAGSGGRVGSGGGTFAEYVAWRRGLGWKLKDIDELRGMWALSRLWEWQFKEPLPDGITAEAAYERMWTAAPSATGWPVKIVTDPGGIAVAFGEFDRLYPAQGPRLETAAIPGELWIGGVSCGLGQWWNLGDATWGRIPERLHRTACAKVALIMETADGTRFPVIITLLRDPAGAGERAWVVLGVTFHNVPLDKVAGWAI